MSAGWHFYEDYLVSPNGDRFTPAGIIACVFMRQMLRVRELLYDWPTTIQ